MRHEKSFDGLSNRLLFFFGLGLYVSVIGCTVLEGNTSKRNVFVLFFDERINGSIYIYKCVSKA